MSLSNFKDLEGSIKAIKNDLQSKAGSLESLLLKSSIEYQDCHSQYTQICKKVDHLNSTWFDEKIGLPRRIESLNGLYKEKSKQLNERRSILAYLHKLKNILQDFAHIQHGLKTGEFSKCFIYFDHIKEGLDEFQNCLPYHVNIMTCLHEHKEYEMLRFKSTVTKILLNDAIKIYSNEEVELHKGITRVSISERWNVEMVSIIERLNLTDEILPRIFEPFVHFITDQVFLSKTMFIVSHVNNSLVFTPQKITTQRWSESLFEMNLKNYKTINSFLDHYLILKRDVFVTASCMDCGQFFWDQYGKEWLVSLTEYLIKNSLSYRYQDLVPFRPDGQFYNIILEIENSIQAKCKLNYTFIKSTLNRIDSVYFEGFFDKLLNLTRDILNGDLELIMDLSEEVFSIPRDIVETASEYWNRLLENEFVQMIHDERLLEDSFELQHIQGMEALDFIGTLIKLSRGKIHSKVNTFVLHLNDSINEFKTWPRHNELITKFINVFMKCCELFFHYYESIKPKIVELPQVMALIYNECMYLSTLVLFYFGPCLWDISNGSHPNMETWSLDYSLNCRADGDELLAEFTQTQKTYLVNVLCKDIGYLLKNIMQGESFLNSSKGHEKVEKIMLKVRRYLLKLHELLLSFLPRTIYLRTIGVLYNAFITLIMDSILKIHDLSDEECQSFHALGISIIVWSREIFDVNREVLYFEDIHFESLDPNQLSKLERLISFLPNWLAFQHLIFILDSSIEEIVAYAHQVHGLNTYSIYWLSNDQLKSVIKAIFGPSDKLDQYLAML